MIISNYMEILAAKFPTVQAHIVGDPSVYENIIVDYGPELPAKEIIEAAALDLARTKMWRDIQASRDMRKSGGVRVGTNWFHSDDTSRIQQIALVMFGANMPPGIMWKTMQGTFVAMTPTLAMQIFQSIAGQDQQIFSRAEYHRQHMILDDLTPDDYDFTTGWSQTYAEWQVAPAPVASFTTDVTTGVAPLTVTFTDTSTNSPTAFAWDFGDGTTGTGKTVAHSYATAGTFTVTHTASNASQAATGSVTMPNYITTT